MLPLLVFAGLLTQHLPELQGLLVLFLVEEIGLKNKMVSLREDGLMVKALHYRANGLC